MGHYRDNCTIEKEAEAHVLVSGVIPSLITKRTRAFPIALSTTEDLLDFNSSINFYELIVNLD